MNSGRVFRILPVSPSTKTARPLATDPGWVSFRAKNSPPLEGRTACDQSFDRKSTVASHISFSFDTRAITLRERFGWTSSR